MKDLDLYLFYATPAGYNASRFPWNLDTHFEDSQWPEHGRQLYTEDDLAHPKVRSQLRRLESFAGRRVDLMTRAIAGHSDGPKAAVRAWLERGARKRRTHPEKRMSSDWHLARAPVVCIQPEVGTVWWDGPAEDVTGIEKGVYQ